MKKEIKMYDGRLIVIYEDNDEIKQKVFDKIIEWCQKHNVTDGEDFQSDDPQIEAPWLISDIVDNIIQFETKWTNEED